MATNSVEHTVCLTLTIHAYGSTLYDTKQWSQYRFITSLVVVYALIGDGSIISIRSFMRMKIQQMSNIKAKAVPCSVILRFLVWSRWISHPHFPLSQTGALVPTEVMRQWYTYEIQELFSTCIHAYVVSQLLVANSLNKVYYYIV